MTTSKIAFSIAGLIAGVLHTSGVVKFDTIGLALFALAVIPWASTWLESVKFGDFEAKFRELKEAVDATQKQLDQLKSTYIKMEKDFLETCAEFDVDASATELNKLASKLKAKAKGLASIDFIFSDIVNTSDEGLVFGAACALHVRPQFQAIDGIIRLLDAISNTNDLRDFRLKTIYRLLMAVDEIIKLDAINNDGLLKSDQRHDVAKILGKIAVHPKCVNDDIATYAKRIVSKLTFRSGAPAR